ncbi:MAG TPA: carboxypeptidase-like regulatory domain-containing protein [Bryobacteraceae bacterium]|nr:carboxypeptidase-like regulatory domain-containing protein [Bryobacteraceae bacterium]
MRSPIFTVVLGLAACFVLFAQGDKGAIQGKLFDATGDVVPGASIQLKSAGGMAFKATTNPAGGYSLSDLPAGKYEITVAVGGLSPFNRKGIAVESAKTLQLDIHMEDTSQLSTLGEDRLAAAANARRHAPPSGPTPRMANGKPDLSGTWWTPGTVDPGKPEFLPNAQAVAKQRTDNNRKDSPQAHCLPSPIIRVGPVYAIVESPVLMALISDDDSPGFHQIFLDGRSLPEDPVPQWYGTNVGHWDGDTLVVDRVGFNERSWLDQESHPHSEKLHVIERYRRPDLGHLETEITVDDPGILARPYTTKRISELAPAERVYEFICPENNRDEVHIVGK